MAATPPNSNQAPPPDEPDVDGTDALAAEVAAVEAEEATAAPKVNDTDELLRKLALSDPDAAERVRAALLAPAEPIDDTLTGDVVDGDGIVIEEAEPSIDDENVEPFDPDDFAPIALDDDGTVFLDAEGRRVDAEGDLIWDGHTVEYEGETWQWAEPSDGGLFLFTSSGSKFLPMNVKGDLSIGFLFSVLSQKSFMRAAYRIMDRDDEFDLMKLYSLVNVIIEAYLDIKTEREREERAKNADRRQRRIAERQAKAAERKALAAGKSSR